MTRAEIEAFNTGVRATLATAKLIADRLAAKSARPLHDGFAVEALEALAELGKELLIVLPPAAPTGPPPS